MQKKLLPITVIVLSLFTIFSLWLYPTIASILGKVMLLLSLAIGIYAIFQKHKESYNSRLKIGKDVLILVFTIVLISFLGGVAGLLTNHYVSISFGTIAGFVCAMLAGIIVGYCVRWGTGKLIR